jgi:hypothetical protein
MAKIDPMRTFAIGESPPRFSWHDLVVVACVIGIAAALVAIPMIADVRDLAAALNISAGPPYP